LERLTWGLNQAKKGSNHAVGGCLSPGSNMAKGCCNQEKEQSGRIHREPQIGEWRKRRFSKIVKKKGRYRLKTITLVNSRGEKKGKKRRTGDQKITERDVKNEGVGLGLKGP